MNLKKNLQSYGRFKNLPWFDKVSDSQIFVGGAGGIGSWVVFFLARAGANVTVVDMDTVEDHNIAGQLYGNAQIGKKKVEALSEVVGSLCGENNVNPTDIRIDADTNDWQYMINRSDAVIVGFDNLKARELVYKQWREKGKDKSVFIDGRLSAESGTVYVVHKASSEDDFKAYEQTYFPESERVELPCSMKATSHCGALIASWIVAQVTNWLTNFSTDEIVIPRGVANLEFHIPLNIVEQPVLKVKEEEYATDY